MSIMEYQVITTSTPSVALLVLTNQSSAIDGTHTVYALALVNSSLINYALRINKIPNTHITFIII